MNKTTRPKTIRQPEMFTELVRSNYDTRLHKTTQDTQITTQTNKSLDFKKRNSPLKSEIVFTRTSEGTEDDSGGSYRVSAVGPAWEQKGARDSMRPRSTSDKRSKDK